MNKHSFTQRALRRPFPAPNIEQTFVHLNGDAMLQTIRNIESVAALCRNGAPLPDPLATWLATSLQSFLDRSAPSMEEAFGLHRLRGGESWRMEAAIRGRDDALRQLAKFHLGGLSLSARASRIHQMSIRYAASAWRFDRERAEMPASYHATHQEWLWKAFKSGAAMPLCPRQLRSILPPAHLTEVSAASDK
jgi:hypothetical protein